MPGIVLTNDLVIGICSHGLRCCPHAVVGYHGSGSPDVSGNGKGVQRYGDFGAHTCPHCGVFMVIGGSPDVSANGRGVARVGDPVTHFCGSGICVTGAANITANEG